MSERRAAMVAVLSAWTVLSLSPAARADDAASDAGVVDVDAVARVTSSMSELRAGPGLAYRVIHRAERGDTFPIQGREATGFWLRVHLPDGRNAYLLGDTADMLLLGELDGASGAAAGFFSPPPLGSATGGLAMLGGVFDANGYAEIRPAFVLNAALSLEPYVGLVMSASGRSLLYGGGASVNLAPDWALAPYVSIGAGGFNNLPNDDQFASRERTLLHARAGGGLLVSLRWRIILRLEATSTVIFDADSYDNVQSYVAGLGSYF